jgi:hypothetical protein
MHNYRPDSTNSQPEDPANPQSTDNASVSQSDLYASYVARFGGDLGGTNDDEPEDDSRLDVGTSKAGSGGIGHDLEQATRSRIASEAMEQDNDIEPERTEISSGKFNQGAIRKDLHLTNPNYAHLVPAKRISLASSSPRLLNPVEIINLTKMTFPGCEAVVDDQGRFVIKGIDRREGVVSLRTGSMPILESVIDEGLFQCRANTNSRLRLATTTFSPLAY